YSYLSSIFYAKAALSGKVNVKTGKILIQEGKILEVRNSMGDICVMTCFLQYSKSGDEEFLEGSYVSMNVRDSANCGRGTVFLRKVATSEFYEDPFLLKRKTPEKMREKKHSVKIPAGKPVVPPRKTPPSVAKTNPPAA